MNSSGLPFLDFFQRPPSVQWESVVSAVDARISYWVWFKPAHFPQGCILQLPEQLPRQAPQLLPLITMRSLLAQAGINPAQVVSWSLNGMTFDTQQGFNPLLDQPVPEPVAGGDSAILVSFLPPPAFLPPQPDPFAYGIPQGGQQLAASVGLSRVATALELELLDSIDAEWNASLALENDLSRHRKQLTDMLGKLKALNRDLNTDERTYSNSQDKKDWQDARRWLRDCHASLARCLKEYDIGFTSKAGQRTWFEETYEKHVISRQPFEGLTQAHADYQIYHKSLQTLLSSIKTGLQHASQNGERRAQKILTAIAAKVRQGGNNNTFLGVVTGS